MKVWDDLTPRHKKYAFFAIWAGLGLGAIAGLVFAAVFGFGFTIFGLFTIGSKWEKKDQAYNTWMAVGLCAIILGLTCFVGAVMALTLHQEGKLIILPQ